LPQASSSEKIDVFQDMSMHFLDALDVFCLAVLRSRELLAGSFPDPEFAVGLRHGLRHGLLLCCLILSHPWTCIGWSTWETLPTQSFTTILSFALAAVGPSHPQGGRVCHRHARLNLKATAAISVDHGPRIVSLRLREDQVQAEVRPAF
jgi:hypothetical protein